MYMTKKAFFTTFTLSTVGVTTYLLTNKQRRKRVLDSIKNLYEQIQFPNRNKMDSNQELQTKIGHPHPRDEGDNNMVSEGAMYSVQYYNEKKE